MESKSFFFKSLGIALAVSIFSIVLLFLNLEFLETAERKVRDIFLLLRGNIPTSQQVVIATIDDKSVKELGHWPWNRDVFARLIDKYREHDVKTVGFDVIFSEPNDGDAALEKAIEKFPRVILPVAFSFEADLEDNETGWQAEYSISLDEHLEYEADYLPIIGHNPLVPIDRLREHSISSGHINIFADNDGLLRWEPLVVFYGDSFIPSMSLSVAAHSFGFSNADITIHPDGLIRFGSYEIPVDVYGRTLIH